MDKIIRYDSEQVPGVWRTRACYVADNMDGYSHLWEADRIAQLMERLQPELMVSKVYMDAYAHKNVGAVSYTHLDVYKRQLLLRATTTVSVGR